jgi:23S rRNA (uracil1939-C5)-methyltransferase
MQKQFIITGLSAEGRGVARAGGKIHFVEGALPGETVAASHVASHSRYDEWKTVEVISASPQRVEPFCAVYQRCGGCALQHCDVEAQREYKQQSLLDQLARIAKIKPKTVLPPITSEPRRYRRRARLAVSFYRDTLQLGLREKAGRHIVEFDSCPVLRHEIDDLLPAIRQLLAALDCRRDIGHLECVAGDDERVGFLLRVTSHLNADDERKVAAFAHDNDCVFYLSEGRDVVTSRAVSQRKKLAYQLLDALQIEFAPTDFVQGNASVNSQLVETVIEWLTLDGSQQVLELFAGIGNFSVAIANRCKQLVLAEGVADMVQRSNAWIAAKGLTHVSAVHADLAQEQLPKRIRELQFDRVLLDPPRDGAREIIPAVAKLKAPIIVYVSCNPATLARDAGMLADAGYVLEKLALADMFPHTEHAECVARFVFDKSAQKKRLKSQAARV